MEQKATWSLLWRKKVHTTPGLRPAWCAPREGHAESRNTVTQPGREGGREGLTWEDFQLAPDI